MLIIVFPAYADDEAVRIMPLGDSITQGRDASYRQPLWEMLRQNKIQVDFVGSVSRGYGIANMFSFGAGDFDVEHEGHWGWRADEVLAQIDEWAAAANPDIVLIHLGTNDIGSGQPVDETTDELRQIILILRKYNIDVDILLAAIIPLANDAVTERIENYNQSLSQLAGELDSPTSHVMLVDHFSGFDAELDTYDGVHPNETGNVKMAEKWFTAIEMLMAQH